MAREFGGLTRVGGVFALLQASPENTQGMRFKQISLKSSIGMGQFGRWNYLDLERTGRLGRGDFLLKLCFTLLLIGSCFKLIILRSGTSCP